VEASWIFTCSAQHESKKRHEIIEGNKLRKLQEADKALKEVIQWVVERKAPHMQELRGKVQEVMNMRQIFNPMLFVMNDGILCHNKHTDSTKPYNALCICLSEARLKEAFQICHEE
jgi:hypothetical protein